ncbi:methylmalonyl-CoA epimerase [Brevibacillus fulvus]|uniref:Methylmalonyl-CoA epimerase n=1 Tax=Brevibacillus fulvus TaxID=1125967 RepID=A0A939BN90_9BACL|nr:methylmalonyl-CoA epimerase [Brevibacillus fulvus]MBM7588615.1 methylmalonyl-CoA epimerase [Brevibacillus fulvus]
MREIVAGFAAWSGSNGTKHIPGGKFAHIGVAVKRIEAVLPFYCEQLGMLLLQQEVVDREQVKICMLGCGEMRLELLEPLGTESPVGKFLRKRGEGMHHLAFEVRDIEQQLAHLRNQGVRLLDECPRQGANDSLIAFLHPQAASGVLIELIQSLPRKESGDERADPAENR